MKLIDEIVELAVDDKTSLPVLLRKCLVLAHRLKNERLKAWAEKELDGYTNDDVLPDYRQTYTISRGFFLGPGGATISDQPIPTAVLKEEHQAIVEHAEFRSPIAAYQLGSKDERRNEQWRIPWPPNLVVMYQRAFFPHYALNRAWMEVPSNFIAALLDTVRNRVLKFALELQEELGSVSDDPAALSPERVDRSVVNIIYGGHNVIAGRVEDVTQAGSIVVMKGDVATLNNSRRARRPFPGRYRAVPGRAIVEHMDARVEARVIEQFGPAAGADIVALANAMMGRPKPVAETVAIPLTRSEARAAGGTESDAFNAKLVQETVRACVSADDPDARGSAEAVVAGLKDIAPVNAREAMIAAQLLATHAAAMDSLKLARGTFGPLRDYHLMHAARLGHAHAALSEAMDRMRQRERRVVVMEYRRAPPLPR
jgi:hypothetical protein